MNIGQRIREERLKQGISMNKLAKTVGMAQSGLSELEAGKRQASFEIVSSLISALGFTLPEFFSDTQPSISPELTRLLHAAEKLTPEQIELLTELIGTMGDKQ